jgi:colanic acid biosynthesis glycosyl transferase WcaI
MNILIHDYSGHPFQVHLSRALAERGHNVTHAFYADNHGPKGALTRLPGDSPRLNFTGISLGRKVSQTALVARFLNDRTYGRAAAHIIHELRPDVVLCGNTPVESQRTIIAACKANKSRFIYWVQDVYGVAMIKLLTKKLGVAGKVAGHYFNWLDHRQFRQSDGIVVISEGFVPEVSPWAKTVSVIENWASPAEVMVGQKDNCWARTHGLDQDFVFLYSGTLGRKHNPALLLKLAQQCQPGQSVAIVGQGVGKDHLEALTTLERPCALRLFPLQPVEQLTNVLATADVLVATIEEDAGKFAVPSKIQSYLCSGRPILLAAPRDNAAVRNIRLANAGIVVEPSDEAGFMAGARRLFEDAPYRRQLGANGRVYAEQTFNLDHITDQFERVLAPRIRS